jgi:hypothetical protein
MSDDLYYDSIPIADGLKLPMSCGETVGVQVEFGGYVSIAFWPPGTADGTVTTKVAAMSPETARKMAEYLTAAAECAEHTQEEVFRWTG